MPGDAPSEALSWAVEAVAKAGTIGRLACPGRCRVCGIVVLVPRLDGLLDLLSVAIAPLAGAGASGAARVNALDGIIARGSSRFFGHRCASAGIQAGTTGQRLGCVFHRAGARQPPGIAGSRTGGAIPQ